ncbi:MAG: hypothetical protein MZW92_52720 [Comamonadaceae bacterium]|nr:hypothetical protein [Comamonadaceae bacterium]
MKSRFVEQWIAAALDESPVRANSPIITVYGDSIAPHSGTVWLGSLIRWVVPLALNPRVVRTSVFRLSRESWLQSEQIGRRSYYSLTAAGRRRFEHAYRRICFAPKNGWDGDWQIVISTGSGLSAAQRDAMRKELLWGGFGAIAPGILAHPSADPDGLLDVLHGTGVHDKVVVLKARNIGPLSESSTRGTGASVLEPGIDRRRLPALRRALSPSVARPEERTQSRSATVLRRANPAHS